MKEKDRKYPTFYRMVPSQHDLNTARFLFLDHYNWSYFGSLVQSDDAQYALVHESFTSDLEQRHGKHIVASGGFSSKLPQFNVHLAELKAKDARIIVGDFAPEFAAPIFCQIYHQRMFGPQFTWLIPGYHNQKWWTAIKNISGTTNSNNGSTAECSASQIFEAMHGHFAVEFVEIRSDRTFTDSGTSASLFETVFSRRCSAVDDCDPTEPYYGYAYDGIWIIANAIDKCMQYYEQMHGVRFNPDATIYSSANQWNSTDWMGYLQQALNYTDFQGVTVKFLSLQIFFVFFLMKKTSF